MSSRWEDLRSYPLAIPLPALSMLIPLISKPFKLLCLEYSVTMFIELMGPQFLKK